MSEFDELVKQLHGLSDGRLTNVFVTEKIKQAAAAISKLTAERDAAVDRKDSLFDAIAHGDEEHRTWLKEAIRQHFAGEPVSKPVGKGLTELRAERAERNLTEAVEVLGCFNQTDAICGASLKIWQHLEFLQDGLLRHKMDNEAAVIRSTLSRIRRINLLLTTLKDGSPDLSDKIVVDRKALERFVDIFERDLCGCRYWDDANSRWGKDADAVCDACAAGAELRALLDGRI